MRPDNDPVEFRTKKGSKIFLMPTCPTAYHYSYAFSRMPYTLHRTDGPAYESRGVQIWANNGKITRYSPGPTVTYYDDGECVRSDFYANDTRNYLAKSQRKDGDIVEKSRYGAIYTPSDKSRQQSDIRLRLQFITRLDNLLCRMTNIKRLYFPWRRVLREFVATQELYGNIFLLQPGILKIIAKSMCKCKSCGLSHMYKVPKWCVERLIYKLNG